jgi:hypothetical protein
MQESTLGFGDGHDNKYLMSAGIAQVGAASMSPPYKIRHTSRVRRLLTGRGV